MKRKFVAEPSSVTASTSIKEEFMRWHEDPEHFRKHEDWFVEVYEILDQYGGPDEDVDIIFDRATEADQRRMLNLIKPN